MGKRVCTNEGAHGSALWGYITVCPSLARRSCPAELCTHPPPPLFGFSQVGGNGIKTCQAAGIEVAVGCEEAACYEINADFMARMAPQQGS